MKLTHKLCGAVLLATLGMAVALPGVTKAEEQPEGKKGSMDIEFTRNTDEDTNTDSPIFTDSNGSQNTDVESGSDPITVDPVIFGVQAVSPLDFQKHAVVNDGDVRTFWAKNYTAEGFDGSNYVLIKDSRTTLNHKYTLSAKITKPMTATVDGEDYALSGSTLTYRNIGILSNQASNLALQEDAIVSSSVVVTEGAESVMINNENADSGIGQSKIYFGERTEADIEKNSNKSVALTVNSDREILEGTYSGEVTWVMATVN
ncbi:WxL domain-containing protein [Enterococcus sp. 5H]|uniref:WxL domain-containing protein n=1 Tax=Enterococcus sp. 5H TaxID=1229490 RepID=UPI00230290FC|nr:WxL domain-containing protein [Enterococcus sp. 5H]MDA9471194.1 hypothetical protein [Enterococcus sp. 5H]